MAEATPKLASCDKRLRTVTGWTILFMVLLRIGIGWHFFYEGVWKMKSGTFSATPYLMASVGPLRDVFRSMVDDVDGFRRIGIVRDQKGNVTGISPDYQVAEIEKQCSLIVEHYGLDSAQRDELNRIKEQKLEEVKKIAVDPDLFNEATAYVLLLKQVAMEEKAQSPKYLQQRMEFNISKTNGARNKLLARVEKPVKEIIPIPIFQAAENTRRAAMTPEQIKRIKSDDYGLALSPRQLDKGPVPLPQAAQFPGKQLASLGMKFKVTTRTQWQDLGMMFGLCAIGACLIFGLFTRLSALFAAVFLSMFYFSMPPWPGVLEVAPLEGHYLIVNKNLVELIACLMIASSRVGRWFGIDAFLGAISDGKRRRKLEAMAISAQAATSERAALVGGKSGVRDTMRV